MLYHGHTDALNSLTLQFNDLALSDREPGFTPRRLLFVSCVKPEANFDLLFDLLNKGFSPRRLLFVSRVNKVNFDLLFDLLNTGLSPRRLLFVHSVPV